MLSINSFPHLLQVKRSTVSRSKQRISFVQRQSSMIEQDQIISTIDQKSLTFYNFSMSRRISSARNSLSEETIKRSKSWWILKPKKYSWSDTESIMLQLCLICQYLIGPKDNDMSQFCKNHFRLSNPNLLNRSRGYFHFNQRKGRLLKAVLTLSLCFQSICCYWWEIYPANQDSWFHSNFTKLLPHSRLLNRFLLHSIHWICQEPVRFGILWLAS